MCGSRKSASLGFDAGRRRPQAKLGDGGGFPGISMLWAPRQALPRAHQPRDAPGPPPQAPTLLFGATFEPLLELWGRRGRIPQRGHRRTAPLRKVGRPGPGPGPGPPAHPSRQPPGLRLLLHAPSKPQVLVPGPGLQVGVLGKRRCSPGVCDQFSRRKRSLAPLLATIFFPSVDQVCAHFWEQFWTQAGVHRRLGSGTPTGL